MRSYNISLAIIFCCFAYQVLIETNNLHYAESAPHTYLFTIISDSPSSLPVRWDAGVFDSFRTSTGFNNYVANKSAVSQQSTSSVFTLTAPFTYILRAFDFMVNVMWNTTFGFGTMLTTFGTKGITVVPTYISGMLTVSVCILHIIAMWQWLRGGDIRAGA